MTAPTPAPAIRVECDCQHCADHAARFGKTMPLAVHVPDRFASSLKRGKSGRFAKSTRHNLVQQGHEQSALSLALRTGSGITPCPS